MAIAEDVLKGLEYPDAKYEKAQNFTDDRRKIYAGFYPALATGAAAAVLCSSDDGPVQHIVHQPDGGQATVVIIPEACKIMYEDLSPSQMVEYRFKDGDWRLSWMGKEACTMYKGQKYEIWKKLLMEPSCEAALRRMLQTGLVNRLFDEGVLPTPPEDLSNWQVTDPSSGKLISIPHPVAELRIWDAAAEKYDVMSAVLDGAPSDSEVDKAWAEILDKLRADHGAEYIDGLLQQG